MAKIKAIENYSEDEDVLDQALSNSGSIQNEELLNDISDNTIDVSDTTRVQSERDIFTDLASKEFPHVTPLQREMMFQNMMSTIRGTFQQICDKKKSESSDSTINISEEDIKDAVKKLKEGKGPFPPPDGKAPP